MKLPAITEDQFLRQVLEYAKLMRWRSAHFRPGRTADGGWRTAVQGDGKGWPDVVLVRGSRMVCAELKRSPKEKATEEQVAWLAALGDVEGVEVFFWHPGCWDEIEAVLRQGATP